MEKNKQIAIFSLQSSETIQGTGGRFLTHHAEG